MAGWGRTLSCSQLSRGRHLACVRRGDCAGLRSGDNGEGLECEEGGGPHARAAAQLRHRPGELSRCRRRISPSSPGRCPGDAAPRAVAGAAARRERGRVRPAPPDEHHDRARGRRRGAGPRGVQPAGVRRAVLPGAGDGGRGRVPRLRRRQGPSAPPRPRARRRPGPGRRALRRALRRRAAQPRDLPRTPAGRGGRARVPRRGGRHGAGRRHGGVPVRSLRARGRRPRPRPHPRLAGAGATVVVRAVPASAIRRPLPRRRLRHRLRPGA